MESLDMKLYTNIKSYSVTWLANTYDQSSSQGIIAYYYLPETMEEMTELCRDLYDRKEKFYVVGSTSNIYIRPNTNIEHLISVKLLHQFYVEDDFLYCECGASVKQIVRKMIKDGMKGYSCMIDLPGTVGGAIYGNASVSTDSIVQQLVDVKILLRDGSVRTFSPDELKFSFRSSSLKRKEWDGIILSCRLKRTKGDQQKIEDEAQMVHAWRKVNQPGAARNLGTTSLLSITNRTMLGMVLRCLVSFVGMFVPSKKRNDVKIKLIMTWLGKPGLAKYLFGLNRYMWLDSAAHLCFDDYIEVINQLYVKPRLEIEVW